MLLYILLYHIQYWNTSDSKSESIIAGLWLENKDLF